MAKIFYDEDANLNLLRKKKVAILGYGNQGRAQAQNMRDSGIDVLIGNKPDESFERAKADKFPTMPISEAVQSGEVLCLLIPDEVQRQIYEKEIAPFLAPRHTLNFAHGYNIRFGCIEPPKEVDVIMVAPRMIGVGVRKCYLEGSGAPAFIAVEQDATGHALSTALAIAKAIGATRVGAIQTTFAEETELDLFSEQAIWSVIVRLLTLAYELLVDHGYQPEAVLLELYASGEAAQVFQEMAEVGLFRQINFHSQTSQYGTLSRGPVVLSDDFRTVLADILNEIQTGHFAKEWEAEGQKGYSIFKHLKASALSHQINEIETRLPQHNHAKY